jgi:serine O-acetyltransferase
MTVQATQHVRTISATEPDWSRERATRFWEPGAKLMRAVRDRQALAGRRGPISKVKVALCILRHRFWSVAAGADIPWTSRIGGGLALPHPNGVVIHPDATIGPNCCFFQQVTVGVGGTIDGAPTIGGQVDIGAGAKVLGGVKIGNYARIGANAVVLCDVPEGCTAVGVPARVLPRER